ncbi:hypothetical protein A0H81_01511 [Grifola frondosa]|uniref:DH domain-containing protein n=1 Tax=Grifola frondosa TaxID=5627 RepID=A0A1C7MTN8_GRIFR|nr:hypothetical protein A0H81_01511 [Grifola frondosa]
MSIPAWDESQSGVFNPYTECSLTDDISPASSSSDHPRERIDSGYSSAVQRDATSPGLERDHSSSGSSSKSAPIPEAKPRISKFTVVNGYRDRSSTAMRRWTLAMADVPDDVLVKQLDKLRREDTRKSRGRASGFRSVDGSQLGHGDDRSMERRERASSFVFGGPQETHVAGHWKSKAGFRVGDEHDADGDVDSEEEAVESDHEEDEEDWKTASKVLFCCRELVRTERNYQARMRELLAMESSHPLFAFVLEYVPDLLYASETLLAHLIDDPSAWGVSAAFIGCEEELEAALVSWSRVVGEFFADGEREKHGRKLTKRMPGEAASSLGHGEADSRSRSITRTMSTLGIPSRSQSAFHLGKTESLAIHRYSMNAEATGNGLFTAALGTGLAFGLSPHNSQTSYRSTRKPRRKSMPSSLSNLHMSPNTPQSSVHVSSTYGAKRASDLEKKLTVRDLAIQPIQRVMRYVLQYRDLLDHTPTTSPSRGLVERAHDSALRIAQKCDRAQTHAAFLRRP